MTVQGIARLACVAALAAGLSGASALAAPIEVLSAQYLADIPFPDYAPYWAQSSSPVHDSVLSAGRQPDPRPLGGSVHVFLKNTGDQTVEVEDLLLEGISLKRAIAFSDQRKFKRLVYAASLYFSDLGDTERKRLIEMGEPVWWRVRPARIGPGECAEAMVRLRSAPPAGLKLTVQCGGGGLAEAAITTDSAPPHIESISFSQKLDTVYLYCQTSGGKGPTKILVDGVDVTERSEIGADAHASLAPVEISLPKPASRMSFHCFQALYASGAEASAGTRAFADEMRMGMWGGKPGKEGDAETGRAYLRDLALHNINLQMEQIGSAAVQSFMMSEEGLKMLEALGIGRVVNAPGKGKVKKPAAYYLADEPDTADYRVEGVPAGKQIGAIAQGLAARAEELYKEDAQTPTMLNLDFTFPPENYYTYGQLPDIFCVDPYYQARLRQAYESAPGRIPVWAKAGYVYAASRLCRSASAPRPLHVILYANRYVGENDEGFRPPTPAEKRIEAYYALAGGASALSFWWYTPGKPARGLGAPDEDIQVLWREVGLIAAEMRTAGPLISRAAPIELPLKAAPRIWARTLTAGLDSLLLVVVNNDYVNDRQGTVIKPAAKSALSLTLPAWLSAPAAFEVAASGIRDVPLDIKDSEASIDLGTVEVTRLIVLTKDDALRDQLARIYADGFAENVRKLQTQARPR